MITESKCPLVKRMEWPPPDAMIAFSSTIMRLSGAPRVT
jgi:hypothetical protein